jgi:hypothetical protein
MSKASLKKHLSDNIGRLFNLTFNHIVMYNTYHKSAVSSLERFYGFLQDGFKIQDNIAISLNQDVLFVEDEPLDSRINTTRIAAHFKQADIQSISFGSGLALGDLTVFFDILTDLMRYKNADAMKKALEKKGLAKIAINYFVYAKVTSDETVVHTSQIGEGKAAGRDVPTAEDLLAIMATDILSDELRKNISIQNLMENPTEFSQMLIDEDIAATQKSGNKDIPAGATLSQSLGRFQGEVSKVLAGRAGTEINISELAEDVFNLKRQLIKGIEDQKAKGVIYLDEQKIREEADEITDGVLVKLITEEYNKGSISINRLAQITLRLVSEAKDFQRILPKLKRALLASGMSLHDFLLFVQEVKNELQSDEMTSVLERSAEAIGLEGEDLIREVMRNPQDAAELIYLAAEIRKSGDDSQSLTDLMVDYVEKVGIELTIDEAGRTDDDSGEKVDTIFSKIRTELVGKLKQRELNTDALVNLEKRLMERMEESIRQLKSSMVFKHISGEGRGVPTKASVLNLLKSHSNDEEEIKAILSEVESALSKRGIGTDVVQQVYQEIDRKVPEKEEEAEPKEPSVTPPGSLNRGSTLFVLEKEILRANRYDTPFSILSFSVVKASPKTAVKRGSIKTEDVIATFVVELIDIIRETDLAGMLGAKMIVVIQPMTEGANAEIAFARITKELKMREFVVNDIPFDIIFAGTVTPYDPERTPDLKAFVKLAQLELKNIADRISNIQRMI